MTTPTFQIPFERRPGTDMATKNLLKHPEVKDIVTKAIVGVDGNAYVIGDSEWADGTRSYVVYVPKDESLGHAPIIIEVQHSVNSAFLNRSIRYCTSAYDRFKMLPVLVIFCINETSGIPTKIVSASTLPCAIDVDCDLWARKCHIINRSSAKKWIGAELHPFTALSLLLVDQETCLLESPSWKDPTMIRLFEILQQILAKSVDRETQLLNAVRSMCDTNIKVYQEILNTSGRLAYSSSIDQHAQQGIEKMRSVKRQFEEDDEQDEAVEINDTNEESSLRSFDDEKYQRAMEFTKQFKNTRKRMNWKACHALTLEKPDMIHYKNAESLRVRFVQYMKK